MTNLINKLLGKSNQPKVDTTLSADEIKPILAQYGIDIETIGFSNIESRHDIPTSRYNANFKDVKITPVKIDNKASIIISGKYWTQATIGFSDGRGTNLPGHPSLYSFEIQDGKLNIKQERKY